MAMWPVSNPQSNAGVMSVLNTTFTALDAGETFTGTGEDIHGYSTVTVNYNTDVSGRLFLEFSTDGVNWDISKPFDGTSGVHILVVTTCFFRARFENTSVSNQTHLRLQTIYGVYRSAFITTGSDEIINRNSDVQLARTTNDPFLDYSRGLYSDRFGVHKYGQNPVVSSGAYEVIWTAGATYNWLTSASALEILSSSAEDDVTKADLNTGTGAHSVVVEGLDANWEEVSVTFTMNGTAAVSDAQTFIRVNRLYVVLAGTYSGANVGTITLRVSGGGSTVGEIAADLGQSQMSVYSVPADYTAYIVKVAAYVSSGSSKDADVHMYRRQNADITAAGSTNAKRIIHHWSGMQGREQYEFRVMPAISEKSDIWLEAKAIGNDTAIDCTYDLILVKFDSPFAPQ